MPILRVCSSHGLHEFVSSLAAGSDPGDTGKNLGRNNIGIIGTALLIRSEGGTLCCYEPFTANPAKAYKGPMDG